MPDTSFTRLRAIPYPPEPSQTLTLALAEHGVDAARLWREDIGRASLSRNAAAGDALLALSEPDSPDGIEGFRAVIDALVAAGAGAYAYCDPGTDYPAAAESHPAGGQAARLTWRDGDPALDEQTLRCAARNDPADDRLLAQLPDAIVGAAAKRLGRRVHGRPMIGSPNVGGVTGTAARHGARGLRRPPTARGLRDRDECEAAHDLSAASSWRDSRTFCNIRIGPKAPFCTHGLANVRHDLVVDCRAWLRLNRPSAPQVSAVQDATNADLVHASIN